jgi:acylphosphatase
MRRAVIIAKGRVQRVGYRDEVEERARRLKITGFVESLDTALNLVKRR